MRGHIERNINNRHTILCTKCKVGYSLVFRYKKLSLICLDVAVEVARDVPLKTMKIWLDCRNTIMFRSGPLGILMFA